MTCSWESRPGPPFVLGWQARVCSSTLPRGYWLDIQDGIAFPVPRYIFMLMWLTIDCYETLARPRGSTRPLHPTCLHSFHPYSTYVGMMTATMPCFRKYWRILRLCHMHVTAVPIWCTTRSPSAAWLFAMFTNKKYGLGIQHAPNVWFTQDAQSHSSSSSSSVSVLPSLIIYLWLVWSHIQNNGTQISLPWTSPAKDKNENRRLV